MVINLTGRQERRATGKKVEIIISVKTVLERSARPQKMVAFEPGIGRAVGRLSLLEIYEEVKI